MWLLAHQGGWDELVLFLVLAVLALVTLRWAGRRARQQAGDEDEPAKGSQSQLRGHQNPPPGQPRRK